MLGSLVSVTASFEPDYAQKVRVSRIQLSGFRNYRQVRLDLSGQHVVLTGHNGAGKTNILEALSLLSPGRGLRRAAYQDIIGTGNAAGEGFNVHVRLECTHYGEVQIGTGANSGSVAEGGGRRVRINSIPATADSLLEYCRIAWLIPAMDGLFTGGASDRRRFLDRMVLAIDPMHGRRVVDYEKSMRARNKLLAEGTGDALWLDALEAQMAELGTAIAAARQEMVRLTGAVIAQMLEESLFPTSELQLSGFLEEYLAASAAAVDVEEEFRARLKNGRVADRVAGRTLEGPHRADLQVFHARKAMPAALCSTGEQKALLTGLVLSHARLTSEMSRLTPILLLDEIAAHLDRERRFALFDILDDLGAQAFMTGTDEALFASLAGRAQFFTVNDARAFPV